MPRTPPAYVAALLLPAALMKPIHTALALHQQRVAINSLAPITRHPSNHIEQLEKHLLWLLQGKFIHETHHGLILRQGCSQRSFAVNFMKSAFTFELGTYMYKGAALPLVWADQQVINLAFRGFTLDPVSCAGAKNLDFVAQVNFVRRGSY